MRMSLSLPIAAALAAIAIGSPTPALSKPLNSCQIRHSFCVERCVMRRDIDTIEKSNACIQRTCDHQFKSCKPDAGGSANDTGGRTRERVVRDKRGRVGDAPATTPASQPAPPVPARPATTGAGGSATGGQPAVRDHRRNAGSRAERSSGVGTVIPVRRH